MSWTLIPVNVICKQITVAYYDPEIQVRKVQKTKSAKIKFMPSDIANVSKYILRNNTAK